MFLKFYKKSFKKIEERIIDYTIRAVQQIHAEPICLILALGQFYFTEIADEIRALRQSSALITYHVAMRCLFDVSFLFCCKIFILL